MLAVNCDRCHHGCFTPEVHRCYFISPILLNDRATLPECVASLERDVETERSTQEAVSRILDEVRREDLAAVFHYTEAFDRVRLDAGNFRVTREAMAEARARMLREEPQLMADLEGMAADIRRFALAQRAALKDVDLPLLGGGSLSGGRACERWVPMRTAGVYIPGGRAFYPSTLAMTVIPAQVAGVSRIVGVTPPKPEGPDPLVLATADLLGLEELYTVGGAQAVAWLAYGEPSVDLVAGPGNRFVAEAKRQLVGRCGIDSVAGPTEVLVIADSSADPAWVAEDLLAQAEHDPDAAAVLLSEDRALLDAVSRELAARAEASPRKAILDQSLSRFARLIETNRELAIEFAQAWAPEHLELVVRDPEAWLPHLTTAGAIFAGRYSAESFGDYGTGPNHVLPTNRTARYSGPLGVQTYMKRQSILSLESEFAARLSPRVARLADAEHLHHHAESARLRGDQAGHPAEHSEGHRA
jgi:histidinol dehydrogenase